MNNRQNLKQQKRKIVKEFEKLLSSQICKVAECDPSESVIVFTYKVGKSRYVDVMKMYKMLSMIKMKYGVNSIIIPETPVCKDDVIMIDDAILKLQELKERCEEG